MLQKSNASSPSMSCMPIYHRGARFGQRKKEHLIPATLRSSGWDGWLTNLVQSASGALQKENTHKVSDLLNVFQGLFGDETIHCKGTLSQCISHQPPEIQLFIPVTTIHGGEASSGLSPKSYC